IDLEVRKEAAGYTLWGAGRGLLAHFDAQGQLTSQTTPVGDINYTWIDGDGDGRAEEPASITAPGGRTATFSYAGGKLKTIAASAGTTTLNYTGADLTSITLPGGALYQYAYDTKHRLTSLTDATAATTQIEYDADGL